jgi:adenosylcobinamide-phosphate synthase
VSHTAPAGARLHCALVGAGALVIDAALGEPPARLHPVVGMGKLLSALRRRSRAQAPAGQLAEGAAGLAVAIAVSALGAAAAQRALRRMPRGAALAGEAAALSTLLALRGLREAAQGVREALDAGDLDAARARAARDLVSRDTSDLDASELSAAAIQSLAENLSDSVVAPLLAYAAGGLPAAAAYRALNTADAMWGYRTPELLYRGRAAARADDAANLIPARLTALYVAARSSRPREALRVALRDHAQAPSPNGGWPMAAMAGALGVRLAKRGSYDFNAEAPVPVASDIGRALGIAGG